MNRAGIYIARGLMSLVFLFAAGGQIMHWNETLYSLNTIFFNWMVFFGEGSFGYAACEFFIKHASTFLGIATLLQAGGALSLLTGFEVRVGAFLLLLFLVPATVIFHAFWFEVGKEFERELASFLKNLSLVGAFLYLLLGPQPEPKKA